MFPEIIYVENLADLSKMSEVNKTPSELMQEDKLKVFITPGNERGDNVRKYTPIAFEPAHLEELAEVFLQGKDIWHHPYLSDRCDENGYAVNELMADFVRSLLLCA